MIDIILFFHRLWEVLAYIALWLIIQFAIITWRWRRTATNLSSGHRTDKGNFPK